MLKGLSGLQGQRDQNKGRLEFTGRPRPVGETWITKDVNR
jgi:hypothetical protein